LSIGVASTEPDVEAVARDVFRICLPLPQDALRNVNVYAIRDGDGLVLVDGGWAVTEAFSSLEKAVGTLGYDLSAISRFLVTHVHRDHLTLALTVRRLFGAKVLMGRGERESLEELIAGRHDGPFRLLSRWGAGQLAAALSHDHEPETEPFGPPDEWIDGPTDIVLNEQTLWALPTPGHTRGHLVYADFARGILFAGDHILPRITPSIGYEPVRPPHPLQDYLASLRRVADLPDLRLLPAHGPVAPSTHQRASELIEHHELRLRETLAAIGDTPRTPHDVASALGWTRHARSFDQLDHLNQALAVSETASHLDVLLARGIVGVRTTGGIDYYERRVP
jgi:glyoxylase-like metal-dependent hydrolase (beta-lactamase superfamily II)